MAKISLIVPVLNEVQKIDGFLNQLKGLPGDWEAIFADGGSTDGTTEKITAHYPVIHAPKGRARQMNEGAHHASGEVFLFLHCDSLIPQDLYAQVEEVLSRGYSFGCFRIRFDSRHPWMRCCSFCSNLRVRLRKIAFGDQGIFLTRELFEQIGGFADLPIMEDYKLSIDLKGKFPLGQTRGYLVTSARRFEQGGMLRTMWKMQVLQHRFRKGVPAQEIARQYRDIR